MKKQDLAIAYNIKRKAKKMADGGKVHKDMDHGQRKGPEGYPKYQEQAQNQKGVHTPVSGVTSYPNGKGTSEAGSLTKDRYAGKPTFEAGPDHPAKKEHQRVLEEMRAMPKPKLEKLAEGGMVRHPNTPFSVKSAKEVRDEEIRRSMEHNEILPVRAEAAYAEGGMIKDSEDLPENQESIMDSILRKEAAMREAGKDVDDTAHKLSEHPGDSYAEGGMIDDMDQPEEEEDLDHDSSIASAIMAKRRMMAEGGQVDLESNAHEDVHVEHDLNLEAAKKENYSESDMLDEDQPMDPNEHGDDIEADKHDMVSMIRRKMKTKSPMVR